MPPVPTTQFVHSEAVDPAEVARVCMNSMPVRRNKYKHLSDEALAEFHQKWQDMVGFPFYGGASPAGSVAIFFPPECMPDRIKPYTKLIECFCAGDDLVTASTAGKVSPEVPVGSMGWDFRKQDTSDLNMSMVKQIQSEIFLELLEVDRPRGTLLIDSLKKFSQIHETQSGEDFQSWDAFLEYRCKNMGAGFNLTIIVYCCGLDLTQSDIQELIPICWPALAASALTNDLYSFNREACLEIPCNANMANAVWHLMKTTGATVAQAKHVLIEEKLLPLIHQFSANKDSFVPSVVDSGTSHRKVFLEMVALGLSGNWYWSAIADRYNRWMDHPNLADFKLPDHIVVDFDESKADCSTILKALKKNEVSQPNRARNDASSGKDKLNIEVLLGPIQYLRSVPSKNIRETVIQALNLWLNATHLAVHKIESIITHLHDSSLLLDDIEDDTLLRRGKPAAHRVFGIPQTVNSATYCMTLAFEDISQVGDPSQSAILFEYNMFLEELRNLHIGQSLDLYWARAKCYPTVTEYLDMIRRKTSSLFCLLGKLLYTQRRTAETIHIREDHIINLMVSLGQFFQVRDDYINLASPEYANENGFASDLDEGKLSLPLIHVMSHSGPSTRVMLENILCERARNGRLSNDLKMMILQEMLQVKSLEFTRQILRELEEEVHRRRSDLEQITGMRNYILRFLMEKLVDL